MNKVLVRMLLKWCWGIILIAAPVSALATHNLAGQITARRNNPNNPNSYEITLTTYTDPAPAGVDRCSADFEVWSTGPNRQRLALIEDVIRSNGPQMTVLPNDCTVPNPRNGVPVKGTVKENIYVFTYIFPGPGEYDIYYYDIARHGSVVNMNRPEEQAFFVGTRLFISPPILGGNNTPVLLNRPLDDACIGKLWTHNPGGFDPDGDSLAYKLSPSFHYDPSQSSSPIVATGYRWPDDPQFGTSDFSIDSLTGVVTWNAPQQPGIYNFGIVIEEWRNGRLLGTVLRDMAVWVIDCNNDPPVIETIRDTCVYAGDTLRFPFKVWDPNRSDSLYFYLNNAGIGNNGPFAVANPATLSGRVIDPFPGFSFVFNTLPVSTVNNNTSIVDTIRGEVVWITNCSNIRTQPYQVDFYATDNENYSNSLSPNLRTLAANKAVSIRIIPPPPSALTAVKGSRNVALQWLPPVCGGEVLGYRIYRKLDAGQFMQDTVCCEMTPLDAGFTLVRYLQDGAARSWVDSLTGLTDFFDKDLCYVVTAVYDVPQLPGLPSLESCATNLACIEILNGPLYLTNDSVAVTDALSGAIFLSWSTPEIDPFFPQPYTFRLYRANNNAFPAIEIASQPFGDTTRTDVGIDTEFRGYNYRVEVFDATGQIAPTGRDFNTGSSIFLTAAGGGNNYIELRWEEYVPWQNLSYEVWRSAAGAPFVLIATVPGTGAPVHMYTDESLNPAVEYCYFIRSAGTYGLPDVKDPLINDSQVACDFARDDQPPCNPALVLGGGCDLQNVQVRIVKPVLDCAADADSVYLYFAPKADGAFARIKTLAWDRFGTDTTVFFTVLENPEFLAGCYAVRTVDSLGNLADLSEPVCLDYCPSLVMSNIFSPNGDGINDLLRPVSFRDVVLREILIFDRWGRLLHTGRSDLNNLWDGITAQSGQAAPEGVYYYVLRYDELRLEGNRAIELKGWVTLVR